MEARSLTVKTPKLGRLLGFGPPQLGGIDVIAANDPFTAEVVRRAEPLALGSVTLPVATPEDLILLKLDANRPHDLDDAIAIKDVHAAHLDRAYLDLWASRLGLTQRLNALLGESEDASS